MKEFQIKFRVFVVHFIKVPTNFKTKNLQNGHFDNIKVMFVRDY